ncbi:glycosyltransferase [Ekhidna sp.]|uniref:glycosyltransferase n=1 Tax=Ekhidna sp. TaxID=2608089 RepID=UPI003B50CE6B
MIFLIGAFTVLNVLFYLKLAFEWKQIPNIQQAESLRPFSVIIPVRNEEKNITHILKDLDNQKYPYDLFEIIVVDDFSDDKTIETVNELKSSLNVQTRLIKLDDKNSHGKKHALTAGVNAAKQEIILTTDADCSLEENWINSYNDAFDETTNMVAGPVGIQGNNLFSKLQQVEFAGLMGFGAVTISKENPSMCSGANLGFRKRAFEEVGGYSDNLFTPSGDDEFLLYNIMRRFPHSTRFMKTKNAVVTTPAHSKLSSFINQRIRWTSKWKYNKNPFVRLSAVLFFIDYLLFYVGIAGALFHEFNSLLIGSFIFLRFIAIWSFVGPVNSFLKGNNSFWPLLIFQIIYPLHVLFMGMNSIFGSYTWKGRKYR